MDQNRWLSLFFILLGIALYWFSQDIRPARQLADPGPAFFPRVIAASMIVFSLVLMFQPTKSSLRKDNEQPINRAGLAKLLLSSVLTIVYVFALNLIGFVIATVIYLTATMWILSPKNPRQLPLFIILSAVITAALMFSLTRWLGIAPPEGILF
jgi:putative tricarboxylic transport membrane protein